MAARVSLRALLALICAAALFATLYWSRCSDLAYKPAASVISSSSAGGTTEDIECSINGEYTVECHRDLITDEVYVPFSFLQKYFEVYGKIVSTDGIDVFKWSHSYSKVFHPKKKYDPKGTFITFENYNVEVRDRVKCISGIEGVPVSTQWDPRGFYYATQIAQFGLAHYSKNLTEPEPTRRILDDGENNQDNWQCSDDAQIVKAYEASEHSNVIRFATSYSPASRVMLPLNVSMDFVLSMDVLLKSNSSIIAVLMHKEKPETVYLHYETDNKLIAAEGEHIYYGIGTESKWRRLTRDLIIDMQKGWALLDKPKRKSLRNKFRVAMIMMTGEGSVDNITLSTSEHMAHFFAAAKWLVANQRTKGGWPVPVRRRIASGVADLAPGWHSAMSQGHAMSVLARAFLRSGDQVYLRAARKALRPLDKAAPQGVAAMWMDKYVWYEEYPTKPPLFVLNGFIYTLLGLYDLHVIEGENSNSPSKKMFNEGMVSLKTLLPLFDTGSGSFYDLRHFTLGVSPNIARWDYHATHVNQLYLLAGLDSDPIIINTAKRWERYMQGKRAAHN